MDEDLRNSIIRTEESVKWLVQDRLARNAVVDKRLDAHSEKIRVLENWMHGIKAGLGIAYAGIAGLFKIAFK